MSFRELTMIDVREVLRRWQTGQNARAIAPHSGTDRKTVVRYVGAVEACGLEKASELTDGLVAEIAQRVQARPLPPPSDARKTLEAHRERIRGWLGGERPLRLVRIHELLAREGVDIGYTTLRRFAHDELGWRERPVTVRLDDAPPGDEAHIDFGLMGHVLVDEVRRQLWVRLVTLSFRRDQFVWPSFTQTVEDVCQGLDAAWAFFGGVVRRLVLDNATSMVVRADAQPPTLQRALAEDVQSRGVFADPARVRPPRDKARTNHDRVLRRHDASVHRQTPHVLAEARTGQQDFWLPDPQFSDAPLRESGGPPWFAWRSSCSARQARLREPSSAVWRFEGAKDKAVTAMVRKSAVPLDYGRRYGRRRASEVIPPRLYADLLRGRSRRRRRHKAGSRRSTRPGTNRGRPKRGRPRRPAR
jgi:hypothetical protein